MTTQQKLIRKKLSLLELGEFLKNISRPVGSMDVRGSIFMTSRRHMKSLVLKD